MTATVATVAYLGLEARPVEVQVQLSAGLPRFTIVGLPDKAVAESRERVHAALASIGLALPPKRITVNLSPADLPKGLRPSALRTPRRCRTMSSSESSSSTADRAVTGRAAGGAAGLFGEQGADMPRFSRCRGSLGR
jgi:hypothetical protein